MPIYVNDDLVQSFIFPGGECHICYDNYDDDDRYRVRACLNDANDIMKLLLTVDAIKRINQEAKIFLTIPYFPYARQDRVCKDGESLSVKVMANLINSLRAYNVTIYDPHSDVTTALLKNCYIWSQHQIVYKYLRKFIIENNLNLVAPDVGASKKILKLSQFMLNNKLDILQATKIRNSEGQIISTQLEGEIINKNFIIIDDICDGGATFLSLGGLLKEKGADDIYLYVTHGIFSKGLNILRPYFKNIFCYHTMLSEDKIDNSFLTILERKYED